MKTQYVYLLIGCILMSLISCTEKTIDIGFSGSLTGKYSHLGVGARNGAMLAVEEINANGGVSGKQLILHSMDDQNDPITAVDVDRKLIQKGVKAIIGHITSSQTKAALDLINQSNILMISPTASSTDFSDKDDHFFRVQTSTRQSATAMGQYMRQDHQLNNILAVFDNNNPSYAKSYIRYLNSSLNTKVNEFAYELGESKDLFMTVQSIKQLNPDAIVFIAPTTDVVKIITELKIEKYNGKLFSSGSAKTPEFLLTGREYVENVYFTVTASIYNESSKQYKSFETGYRNRYGRKPNFAAATAYIATHILAKGLSASKNYSAIQVKQQLLVLKQINILGQSFNFNTYGDVDLPSQIYQVRNGQFQLIKRMELF